MIQRPAYVRQLASELEMLAHGACASWNPAGGNGVPDSRPPSGDANPPHMQFLADWDKRGDRVLDHWLGELKRWRGHGQVRPAGKSEDELILEDGAGHAVKDVALRFRCTETRVRRLRVGAGLDAETGATDLRATVRDLREQKVSYREIAARLGRSKSQVERVDKAA